MTPLLIASWPTGIPSPKEQEMKMKVMIASLAALGLVASPALATTTPAKTAPTTTQAKGKTHRNRSNATMAQTAHKKAPARSNAKKPS
jgi:hypothetical protein